jgi:hypothetical protein
MIRIMMDILDYFMDLYIARLIFKSKTFNI